MDVSFARVQSKIDAYPFYSVPTIESPYMNINFTDVAAKIVKAQDKAMEEYLLEYFGSADEAIEFAKYYTLDTSDLIFDSDTSLSSDEFKLKATVIYRVRVKTPEELNRTGVYEPWPEFVTELQKVEAEREALIAKDYDEALIRSKDKK